MGGVGLGNKAQCAELSADNTTGITHHLFGRRHPVKVQVTFDLSEDERIAIGVAETQQFKQATREEAREYLTKVAKTQLSYLSSRVTKARQIIVAEVEKGLKG
jgi:hypothetical protein